MGSRGDFHSHSTISDGRLTPTELVDLAYRNGVRILSLTDHDTIDGLREAFAAAEKYSDMMLVPGIEMSTDVPGNEVHILGHFIDWQDAEFGQTLRRLQESRLGRAEKMVARLGELQKPVEWARVLHFAGEGAVGRPHIALALVEAGHVGSVNEAFDLYLSRTGPAYVERERLEPEDVVKLILNVGGLVTLAHPRELRAAGSLPALLDRLKAVGLDAMEVYYQDYNPDEVAAFKRLAEKHGLLPLGGSDYHALGRPEEREPGDIPLPDEAIDAYLELARKRNALDRARLPRTA